VVEIIGKSLEHGALLSLNPECEAALEQQLDGNRVASTMQGMLAWAKKSREAPKSRISPFVVDGQDFTEFAGIDIAIVDGDEIRGFNEWHPLPHTGILNVTYECGSCGREWLKRVENPNDIDIPDCDCGASSDHIRGCDEDNRLCEQRLCQKVIVKEEHPTKVRMFDEGTNFYHEMTEFDKGSDFNALRKAISTPLMWSTRIELWDGYMLKSGYERENADGIRSGICRFLEFLKEARQTAGTPLHRLRITALPLYPKKSREKSGMDEMNKYLISLLKKNEINQDTVSKIELRFESAGMGERYIVFENDGARLLYEIKMGKGITESLQSAGRSNTIMNSSQWFGPLPNPNTLWDAKSKIIANNTPHSVITSFD
jgi:hypothetical protein